MSTSMKKPLSNEPLSYECSHRRKKIIFDTMTSHYPRCWLRDRFLQFSNMNNIVLRLIPIATEDIRIYLKSIRISLSAVVGTRGSESGLGNSHCQFKSSRRRNYYVKSGKPSQATKNLAVGVGHWTRDEKSS